MDATLQPLVSIVTPVYNGAQYLPECIESILAQTYQNWDYTIINNCSTDETMDIARRYAARDSRIRIHENREKSICPSQTITARFAKFPPQASTAKWCLRITWIFRNVSNEWFQLLKNIPSVGIVSAYVLQGWEVICTGLPYCKKKW